MLNSLSNVEPYVAHLERLTLELSQGNLHEAHQHLLEVALNGELSRTLRTQVPLQNLRNYGAFFTSEAMAEQLVAPFEASETDESAVLDAACGGGNLLLAYARKLPLQPKWGDTVESWGTQLKGSDIHEIFIRATRARLSLLAVHRGLAKYGTEFLRGGAPQLDRAFPYIQVADSLTTPWPEATTILLNPPFNRVPCPKDCSWAGGKVSQAALFVLACLKSSKEGSTVRAILPDVLRSGTIYRKWRLEVEKFATITGIEILGKFDAKTDVNVFFLSLKVGAPERPYGREWWLPFSLQEPAVEALEPTVGDFFTVHVGRVVPTRDPEEGPLLPYLDYRHVPPWTTIELGSSQRRFSGTTFTTPFVIIRRNSRPDDIFRAVGTIVKSAHSSESVAVENHLLVAKPKSGQLKDCRNLIKLLRKPDTTQWLNGRVCCRHLPTSAIASIPWRNL